jgi:Domain of unknown function (DUF4160)
MARASIFSRACARCGGDAHDQRILRHSNPDVLERPRAAHFHALYAAYEAAVDIGALEVIDGGSPRRGMALMLEWAQEHGAELMENWDLCDRNQSPKTIQPLR